MNHRNLLQQIIGVTLVMMLCGVGCASPRTLPVAEAPAISPPSPTATPRTGQLNLSAQPSLEVVGQLGGATHAAFIQGEYGYLSVGQKLLVLNLSDPAKPEAIGSVLLPDIGLVMAELKGIVYVGGSKGLYLVDVSQPTTPTLVSSFNLAGRASGVAVQSDPNSGAAPIYVYLTYTKYNIDRYEGGVLMVDVSNPTAPAEVGSLTTPGVPEDIVVMTTDPAHIYAYVAEWEGLRIWDISDSTAPRELSFYPTDASARQVAIKQNQAYIAQEFCNIDSRNIVPDCKGGLLVLDVADPANPKRIGSIDTPLSHSIIIAGNYAYVDNLHILNISDPANITEISILFEVREDKMWGNVVAVKDQYAYLFNWQGLNVVNVAKPSAATKVAFYDPPGPQNPGDIATVDGHAYVADRSNGLAIIDVSNPVAPTEVGDFPSNQGSRIWAVADQRVYLGDETGLEIIDVANPTAPTKVGAYQAAANDISGVTDHRAYLSNPTEARVVNLADPTKPVETRVRAWPDPAGGWAAVVNGYAYAAFYDEGWRVVDLSNPAKPVEFGFISGLSEMFLADGYSYNAFSQEMRIVDLTDLAHPIPRGSYQVPGSIWEISAVANGLACLLVEGRLHLVDVSDPDRPQEVGGYGEPYTVRRTILKERYLYLIRDVEGVISLQILDISDPFHLVELGHYVSSGSFLQSDAEIELVENYAYLFDQAALGLEIIDVSNPTMPTQVALHEDLYQIWAVEAGPAGQTYAYLYDVDRNVRIIELTNPQKAVEVGFFDAPGSPGEMRVLESRIYINSDKELVVVDASNPAKPVEMGRYEMGAVAGPIYQFGNHTYIPTSRYALQVIDLVNSPEPQSVGFFTGLRPDQLEGIIADQSRVYVKFWKSNGADQSPSMALQIIDVNNPTAPHEIGYYYPEDSNHVIGIRNNYLYLSDQESRQRIIDLSDPANPAEVIAPGVAGGVRAVAVEGDYIYLTGDDLGLAILRLKP